MIDSHCHLDHEPLYSNIGDVIKRSKENGLKKILTISTNSKSFENIKKNIKHQKLFIICLVFIIIIFIFKFMKFKIV